MIIMHVFEVVVMDISFMLMQLPNRFLDVRLQEVVLSIKDIYM